MPGRGLIARAVSCGVGQAGAEGSRDEAPGALRTSSNNDGSGLPRCHRQRRRPVSAKPWIRRETRQPCRRFAALRLPLGDFIALSFASW